MDRDVMAKMLGLAVILTGLSFGTMAAAGYLLVALIRRPEEFRGELHDDAKP